MNTKELFAALEMLEKEKGIPMDYMIENIEKGIEVACKNYYGGNDEVVFKILPDRNVFDVRLMKTVVEEDFLRLSINILSMKIIANPYFLQEELYHDCLSTG